MTTNPAMHISEATLQRTVIDTAKFCGWRVAHIRAALNSSGRWSLPYEGDIGLPDLILAKGGRLLCAELKSDKGQTTPEQRAWLAAAGHNSRLWRPADLPDIITELRSKP